MYVLTNHSLVSAIAEGYVPPCTLTVILSQKADNVMDHGCVYMSPLIFKNTGFPSKT